MIPFPIKNCPLCSKKLLIGDEDSKYTYFCKEYYLKYPALGVQFSFKFINQFDAVSSGLIKESHYSIIISNGLWLQNVLIAPYWIVSNYPNNYSDVYKLNKRFEDPSNNTLIIDKLSLLNISNYLPEQLVNKLDTLVMFK